MEFIIMAIGWTFLWCSKDHKYSDLFQTILMLIGGILLITAGGLGVLYLIV